MMNFIDLANQCAKLAGDILPPAQVMKHLEEEMNEFFMVNIIGKSKKGHPIKLYSYGQDHLPQVLFYGLPDPGEIVGASGILGLMRALKDPNHTIHRIPVRWNFLPLLNVDDQPNDGATIELCQKTADQEVDWMIDRPRPETKALLNLNDLLNPVMIFPMHDEFHTEEVQPCYFPISKVIPHEIAEGIRQIVKNYGLEISKDIVDPQMGEGFLNINNIHDIYRSTFSHFAKNGLLYICEVPRLEKEKYLDLISIQLATAFLLLAHTISTKNV